MPRETPTTDDAESESADEETVNRASALWTRSKNEITDEEYTEFYRHIGHDFGEPVAHVHSHMEGKYEYTLLLFIPARAPFDLWDRDSRHGVKLYVRRVFIMEDAHQLLPRYLRFVRGVIDSSDLPLNISREMLQHSRIVDNIRVRRCQEGAWSAGRPGLEVEPEKYATVWSEFGRVLKEGVAEDPPTRRPSPNSCALPRHNSSGDTPTVSLDDYVGRMQEGQEKIYYLTAETMAMATNSPLLEIFRKKGIEVLFSPTSSITGSSPTSISIGGKQLQSIAKADIDAATLNDEEEKSAHEQAKTEFQGVTDRLKTSP